MDENPGNLIGFIVGWILGRALMWTVMDGVLSGKMDEFRREAAKLGHAEYYIDEKFQRAWRWKECK